MVSVTVSPSASVAPETPTVSNWWFAGQRLFGLGVTVEQSGGELTSMVTDADPSPPSSSVTLTMIVFKPPVA